MQWTVGRLAKRFGLSRSTLLYYDGIGLLRPQSRAAGEYRTYGEAEAARLERICLYRRAGLTLEQIKQGIETLQSVSGRFHIIETGKYTVVDDCYNANPVSMKASLDVLKEAKGRKVAVLGDMGELGTDEAALHAEVGTHAGTCGIDALYCA